MNENLNVIDMISVDEASGYARLHLIVTDDWVDCHVRLEWIRKRLNAYLHFVLSGQLEAQEKYRGRRVKIVIHSEYVPPESAIVALGGMGDLVRRKDVDLALTVGRDLTREVACGEKTRPTPEGGGCR